MVKINAFNSQTPHGPGSLPFEVVEINVLVPQTLGWLQPADALHRGASNAAKP